MKGITLQDVLEYWDTFLWMARWNKFIHEESYETIAALVAFADEQTEEK